MNLAAPLTKQDIISERCGVRALVVNQGSKSDNQDWHKLSRKHFVETDSNGVISILGGKFTDCLNVGDEIIDAVSKFLPLNEKASDWIGEGSQSGFKEFMDRAISVLGRSNQTQELITQLWRRHGIDGMQILNRMELEPSERELVFEGLWITIGELRYVAKEEAVRTASDLLRRRLPIAMVRTPAEIQGNQKLQKLLLESGLR
jgi:glycerol-3-phosphate dehydrogenase